MRPFSLVVAFATVALGIQLAWLNGFGDIKLSVLVFCAAIVLQLAVNLLNDLSDIGFSNAQGRKQIQLHANLGRVLLLVVIVIGIYPPGTVVKLSDGNIAMVISAEPEYVQRPDVILYDPSTPKEDATIIRLKYHDSISILNAMNPGTYPPKIHDYFKLSDRIGYMVQSQSA